MKYQSVLSKQNCILSTHIKSLNTKMNFTRMQFKIIYLINKQ